MKIHSVGVIFLAGEATDNAFVSPDVDFLAVEGDGDVCDNFVTAEDDST